MAIIPRTEKTEPVFAAIEKLCKEGWYGRFAGIIQNGKVVRLLTIADPPRREGT